jgi:hypothetical protein
MLSLRITWNTLDWSANMWISNGLETDTQEVLSDDLIVAGVQDLGLC